MLQGILDNSLVYQKFNKFIITTERFNRNSLLNKFILHIGIYWSNSLINKFLSNYINRDPSYINSYIYIYLRKMLNLIGKIIDCIVNFLFRIGQMSLSARLLRQYRKRNFENQNYNHRILIFSFCFISAYLMLLTIFDLWNKNKLVFIISYIILVSIIFMKKKLLAAFRESKIIKFFYYIMD